MRLLRIVDVTQQVFWMNPAALIGIIIPALTSPGDGKCRVLFEGGLFEVARTEAENLLIEIKGAD